MVLSFLFLRSARSSWTIFPVQIRMPRRVADLRIRQHGQKALVGEVFNRRRRIRMTEHALRGEYDQRFAPVAQRLAPQQVKILHCIRRLADLKIVPRRELQEAFDASAGVLRPLPFVTMRQKQHDAREQSPFVFAGADKLINHRLRDVGEIAELRLPHHQRFGIVPAVAVLESQYARLGERGIIDFAARLALCDVFERNVLLLVLDIEQHGVALVKGAASRILPGQANRYSGFHQASKRQRFSHAVVHQSLARTHLGPLLQQLFDLGMDVEVRGIGRELRGNFAEFFR